MASFRARRISKEGKSNGQILEEIDRISRDLIREILNYRTEGSSLHDLAKDLLGSRFLTSDLQESPGGGQIYRNPKTYS